MKAIKRLTPFLFIIVFLSAPGAFGSLSDFSHVPLRRRLQHAEEFYLLYRENMYRGTENLNANIFWLEHALKYPFAPPVQALAKIESPRHWTKYKQLFRMHMHHLITENYLRLGERYEKNRIFFFNHTFKKEILEGLQITKLYYQRAQHYWDKVKSQAEALWEDRDTELAAIDGEVEKWQDLVYKIHFNHIEVNYPKQIKKRLQEVEKKISMMQKGDYEQ